MRDTHVVRVDAQGGVVIPAEVRQQLGIESGSKLVVKIDEDVIVLVPREALMRRLQAKFSGMSRSMTDELLADRRAEAAAEAAVEGWVV